MELQKQESIDSKCIICREKLSFYSIGKCNHKQMCYYCTLKNRQFYDDTKCPLCNTNLSIVFICPISEDKTFEELEKEDLSLFYKDKDESKDLGIYYTDISSYEAALQLKAYKCPIDYCVKTEPFETYEDLVHHLMVNHQKFYCKVCIKDGKKFISEQKVYEKNEIKEHNLYGDIEEDIPPHHFCPFCKDLFYDDEILYKHMTSSHFMCEICKSMNKTIIFYSALPNIIEHNKLYHYCCPFKDCKDVLYIAFGSKKKLIEHFETKHNQKDNKLNEKMANENIPKIIEDPTFYDISLEKDEFNYNDYIQKVNKRCIQHRENKFKKDNEENNDIKNKTHDEIEIIYTNQPQNKYKNNEYHERNNRNNNYQRGRGRGRWRGKNFRVDGKNVQLIKQEFNKYEPEEDSEDEKEKDSIKDNYVISISNILELIKKYIIERIKSKKISRNEMILPKDTQYQIIIVIDKIKENEKIMDLSNIQIFGLDWDIINKFKDHLKNADLIKENDLFNELDSLSIKNILVLYKYLITSYKKMSGEFYKLEMDEINEDLYYLFFPNEKNKIDNKRFYEYQSYNAFSLKQNINSNKNKKPKKNKNKFVWNQPSIPGLTNIEHKKPKTKKNKEEEMKKNFDKYIKKCKEEDEKLEKEKNKDKEQEKKDKEEEKIKNNNGRQLAMLISSIDKNTTNKKKKKVQKGEFKLSAFNMDEDFPPLK